MKKIIALLALAASLSGCATIQDKGQHYITEGNQKACLGEQTVMTVLGLKSMLTMDTGGHIQDADDSNYRFKHMTEPNQLGQKLCKVLPDGMGYHVTFRWGIKGSMWTRVREANLRDVLMDNGDEWTLMWGADKLVEKD